MDHLCWPRIFLCFHLAPAVFKKKLNLAFHTYKLSYINYVTHKKQHILVTNVSNKPDIAIFRAEFENGRATVLLQMLAIIYKTTQLEKPRCHYLCHYCGNFKYDVYYIIGWY